MGCCTERLDQAEPAKLDLVWERKPRLEMGRREMIVGSAGLAGLAMTGRARAQATVKLAFCSQLLCVVPYEFTRAQGFFDAEGISVELVYTRGGNAAMQALVGGAVDYAATSFDVALQAFANDAPIRRFATTGRLPLFALAVAPGEVDAITKRFKKALVERMLGGELTHHLGYPPGGERPANSTNQRNGSSGKTVLTDDVPLTSLAPLSSEASGSRLLPMKNLVPGSRDAIRFLGQTFTDGYGMRENTSISPDGDESALADHSQIANDRSMRRQISAFPDGRVKSRAQWKTIWSSGASSKGLKRGLSVNESFLPAYRQFGVCGSLRVYEGTD